MADWTKLHLINAVDWASTQDGMVGRAKYWCLVSDLDAIPVRGDSADSVKTGYLVNNSQTAALSAYTYMVAVEVRKTLSGSEDGLSGDDLLGKTNIDYEIEEFYLSAKDVYALRIKEQDDLDLEEHLGSDYKGWTTTFRDKYGNQMDASVWATYTPKTSPFTTKPDIDYIEKRGPTLVAVITYFTPHAPTNFEAFVGVNTASNTPDFCNSIPNIGTPGAWRAVNQTTSQSFDNEGNEYYRIVRRLQRAPKVKQYNSTSYLLWDSAKNGGNFTW